MRVTKRYNQHRRDLKIDLECEGCGATTVGVNAYDDHYFWSTVVPDMKCKSCGESARDFGLPVGDTSTRYPEGMTV